MIEAIIVGLVLIGLIFYLVSRNTQTDSYKEGDYVVWFGGLYKVISVEDTNLVIKHIKYSEKHIVNSERNSIEKVSKNFADKYLKNYIDK